jgi:hypothetical protein
MPIQTIGYQIGPDEQRAFKIRSEPHWTHVIETIVDRGCALTGHRWCMSAAMVWSSKLSDRHASEFTIPATDQLIIDYCQWRGERPPLFDHEETDPAADVSEGPITD